MKCIIDLARNVLRIGDIETPFLGESEIPKSDTFNSEEVATSPEPPASTSNTSGNTPKPVAQPQPQQQSQPQLQIQPPERHTLPPQSQPQLQPQRTMPQPAATVTTTARAPVVQQQRPSIGEDLIKSLVDLGATREQAIQALTATGGNVDLAAGLLFEF